MLFLLQKLFYANFFLKNYLVSKFSGFCDKSYCCLNYFGNVLLVIQQQRVIFQPYLHKEGDQTQTEQTGNTPPPLEQEASL